MEPGSRGGAPDNFSQGHIDDERLHKAELAQEIGTYSMELSALTSPGEKQKAVDFMKSVGMPIDGGLRYFEMHGVRDVEPAVAKAEMNEAIQEYVDKLPESDLDAKTKTFMLNLLRLNVVRWMSKKEEDYAKWMDRATRETNSKDKIEMAEIAESAVHAQDDAVGYLKLIDKALASLPPAEEMAA